ncbi:hypothetical protein MAM1_0173c07242, partial [Mucor ambiguus]
MVTTRSKGTVNKGAPQPSGSSSRPSATNNNWVLVTKGNKGKHRHVPFTPTTIVQPSAATSASSQALSDDQHPSPVELVRPFIKGFERNSVLIDITHIKDIITLLENRLKEFNTDNPTDYNDFIGYPETVRTYLGHRFIETMWLHQSKGHQTILNEGVCCLSDGTFVKGFESYPNDANIVHVKLENLPFLPARLVIQDMKRILSFYGEVLDLGITQVNGVFHGKGYATLNLTKPRTVENICISTGHAHGHSSKCDGYLHFHELTRVIPWEEDDGFYRHVLAQWDSMPEFCRTCQKAGHCRADCPQYRKHLTCYHCNDHGHISRNCPRLAEGNKVRVVEATSAKHPASPLRQPRRREPQSSSKINTSRLEKAAGKNMDVDALMEDLVPSSAANRGLEQATQRSTDSDQAMEDATHLPINNDGYSHPDGLQNPSYNNKTIPPRSPALETGDEHTASGTASGTVPNESLNADSSQPPAVKGNQRTPHFDEDSHITKSQRTATTNDVSDSRKLTTEEHRQDLAARAHDIANKIVEAANTKFIRYLHTLQYDILVLQETHADNQDTIDQFNMQFKTHNRANSIYWTPHCGIVILNKKYSLDILQDGIDNGRFILANVQLTSTVPTESVSTPTPATTIATILNIYGRSNRHPERSAFYSSLLDIPLIHSTLHHPQNPVLIMGDFNYSYENHRRSDGSLTSAPPEWLSLLDNFHVDCFWDHKQITWKTKDSSSILDFIFCSSLDHYKITNAKHRFLSTKWTDHALLDISFQYTDQRSRGPGAWKANPFLAARRDYYRSALAAHLRSSMDAFNDIQSFSTPQQSWDWVKAKVKLFTKSYQLKDNNWRKQQIKHLQKKRNLMYRLKKTRGLYFGILGTIEAQIGSLQESLAEIEILKSGKHWRENGEKSAGYLKRSATIREQQRG